METSADRVFPLYKRYVDQLRHALSALPSGPVAESYRVPRLSPSEFDTVWAGWGRVPGLQETWLEKFAAGYDADAEVIRQQFEDALAAKTPDRKVA